MMPRRFSMVILSLLVLVVSSSHVFADEIPDKVRKLFARAEGKWKIKSTLEGKTVESTLTFKLTPNKEGIVWYWQGQDVVSGQVATSVGLMCWDGQRQEIVENMISSNGVTFTATWTGAGNRWTSRQRGTELIEAEYKTFFADRVMEWESDSKMIIVQTNRRLAGKPQPNIKNVFQRVK